MTMLTAFLIVSAILYTIFALIWSKKTYADVFLKLVFVGMAIWTMVVLILQLVNKT
jgi:hypothetical protein